MARYEAKLAGGEGEVFAHLPFDQDEARRPLAADGVSCSVCHQIIAGQPRHARELRRRLHDRHDDGQPASGTCTVRSRSTTATRTVMHSSATSADRRRSTSATSELCATCHTLFTQGARRPGQADRRAAGTGAVSGVAAQRLQGHAELPVVPHAGGEGRGADHAVFGEPRTGISRHTFVGGNFFMQRMLNQYRDELGVKALPQELDAAANRTVAHLQSEAARVTIGERRSQRPAGSRPTLSVENLGGHKLPTAYPSRRAWLHVMVRDRNGAPCSSPARSNPTAPIHGNDNDADATRFEPHYTEITSPDQVQIYETVMVDPTGALTTGLLTAVRYVKDNRLLPQRLRQAHRRQGCRGPRRRPAGRGFHRRRRPRPLLDGVGEAQGPFQVEAELWYQPIAYRWANNLKQYDASEPRRFTGYYDSMSSGSGIVLARASARHSYGTSRIPSERPQRSRVQETVTIASCRGSSARTRSASRPSPSTPRCTRTRSCSRSAGTGTPRGADPARSPAARSVRQPGAVADLGREHSGVYASRATRTSAARPRRGTRRRRWRGPVAEAVNHAERRDYDRDDAISHFRSRRFDIIADPRTGHRADRHRRGLSQRVDDREAALDEQRRHPGSGSRRCRGSGRSRSR